MATVSKFLTKIQSFHDLFDEKRVAEARDLIGVLTDSAQTVTEKIQLGFCQSRAGMFEEAERSLDFAWSHLEPRSIDSIHVAGERAIIKYHLGKMDEASSIEKMIFSNEWYRVPENLDENSAAIFSKLFYEKILKGGESIAGKSVFMIFLGGLGDAIEQCRNFKSLAAEGAGPIFADPPAPLRELLAASDLPITLLRATAENLSQCDYLAFGNILNLRYFDALRPQLAHPGYLTPARGRKPQLLLPEDSRKYKVGIVWRSTNANWQLCRHEPFRSMELSTLEPALKNPDVRFYSLQFGEITHEEKEILQRHGAVNASPYIHSFLDLADIVKQLDLVISVDSAPAHLCGAMNVPIWNMLAAVSDCRWGSPGQHSTRLYPSMRLFRQTSLGDWLPVVCEIDLRLTDIECQHKRF